MPNRTRHSSPSSVRGTHTIGRAAPSSRVLALDYGRRRIGLALSDELQLIAQPLATLERTNRRDDLRRLREFVRKHGVCKILVGHPVHLDGAAGEMTAESEKFAARIEKDLALPVELIDERLTSWEAAQTLAESYSRAHSHRRPRNDHSLHAVAAAVILREYLDRQRAHARAAAKA